MATKKVKRYNGDDGSMVDQDLADQEATAMMKRATDEGERDEKALPAGYKVEPEAPAKSAPAARSMQSGPGRKPSRPNPNYSNEGRSSTAAKSSAGKDYSNEGKGDSKYRKQTMTAESQALEGVHPEQYLMPGVGIKTIANAAKALANRGGANTLRKVSQEALPAPTRQIGYDKAGAIAKQRAARAEGRNSEMLSENARRSGVKPGSAGAEAIRKKLGGDDWTLGMKRGGSVSSASSRADGIATKGKTRGKMY